MDSNGNKSMRDEFIELKVVVTQFIKDTKYYRDNELSKKLEKLSDLPCRVHLERMKNISSQLSVHWWLFGIIIVAIIGAFTRHLLTGG